MIFLRILTFPIIFPFELFLRCVVAWVHVGLSCYWRDRIDSFFEAFSGPWVCLTWTLDDI